MHAETARDFLEIHLPVELRELCDLNTLHLESGSFIEESLKGHSTDVLYSVQMQGNPGYLHVVIEHQSKPDKKNGLSHDALFYSRHAPASGG